MGEADFVGTKYFAGTPDGVVFGMVEVVMVGNVRANLRREELRIEGRFLRARIAIQPGPIGKGKRLRLRGLRRRSGRSWRRNLCRGETHRRTAAGVGLCSSFRLRF